jgi:hypothetical protein
MNGYEQEIIIPGEHVERAILRPAEHEAGHIIAAHHFHARVLGIAVGFVPGRSKEGMFLQALYGWKNSTIETECVVKAAGPAADILFHGSADERGASGDLQDIATLTGHASFEPFLSEAKAILAGYAKEFICIKNALRRSLELDEERTLGLLPNNQVGTLLLDEGRLIGCLSTTFSEGWLSTQTFKNCHFRNALKPN